MIDIVLIVALLAAALRAGYYWGKSTGIVQGSEDSNEELEKLKTILESAGLRIDNETAKAHSDVPPEATSWTGLPIDEAERIPVGRIPRWDEMHKRK